MKPNTSKTTPKTQTPQPTAQPPAQVCNPLPALYPAVQPAQPASRAPLVIDCTLLPAFDAKHWTRELRSIADALDADAVLLSHVAARYAPPLPNYEHVAKHLHTSAAQLRQLAGQLSPNQQLARIAQAATAQHAPERTPADYLHRFDSLLPPDVDTPPICGADLPRDWTGRGKPLCPACELEAQRRQSTHDQQRRKETR